MDMQFNSNAAILTICVLLAMAMIGPFAVGIGDASDAQDVDTLHTGDEPLEPKDIDSIIEETMTEHDVAGATVAYVEGDEIVHTEGYGYADYEAGESVDPDETSFMIGSVSKLLVWTAVMQGVEDGTLDLDEPIGTYLDDYEFEGDDEVTLAHLATHSGGYDDRFKGIFVQEHSEIEEWERKLESEMPPQIWEPGETISYSNHGTVLAGLVIQEAYGKSLESYIEDEIFDPLGMDSATFVQPAPEDRTLSKGHVPVDDGFETRDPTIVGIPPAGSVSATGPDMGAFALAKLQDGTVEHDGENVQVLEPASVAEMFDQQATNHPSVQGLGYGYMLSEYRGEQLVMHTGGTEYFHTLFILFPEHDVGLFVSFNSMAPFDDILDEFIDERFVPAESSIESDPTTADRADEYAGEYRMTTFQTTHEKFLGLAQGTVTASVTDDRVLELTSPEGEKTRWVEVEPGVFEPKTDDDASFGQTSVAIEDGYLYMNAPASPFERLSWYETAGFQVGLAGAVIVTLFSTIVIWPVNAYRHRGWGAMRGYLNRSRLAILGCVVLLVAFIGGVALNPPFDMASWVYGFSLWQRLTFGLLYVLAIGAVVTVASVGIEWKQVFLARDLDAGSTSRYGLVYLTALVMALLVLLWQAWYWNLFTAAF